ncbi:hypothetical protein MASR2M74_24100 [Paracoccaceae bacterium]
MTFGLQLFAQSLRVEIKFLCGRLKTVEAPFHHLFIQRQFMAIKRPGAHDVVSQDRTHRFKPWAASAAPLQPFMDSPIAPLWAILIGALPIAQGLEELQNRIRAVNKNSKPG